jgi:serine protease inhibitor
MKLFLPHSALAFEVLQSRFGGYDLFNIDAEVARGYFEHQGPLNLTLPNQDLDYSFELSRPLQSFGIIKMFNEGLSRKQYQENLIAADMWQRARFKMRHLQRAFKASATNKEEKSYINLEFNRPFFFSLTNIHSNVIQMFGLIMNHTSFYEES